jgi:hypothetical protein
MNDRFDKVRNQVHTSTLHPDEKKEAIDTLDRLDVAYSLLHDIAFYKTNPANYQFNVDITKALNHIDKVAETFSKELSHLKQ